MEHTLGSWTELGEVGCEEDGSRIVGLHQHLGTLGAQDRHDLGLGSGVGGGVFGHGLSGRGGMGAGSFGKRGMGRSAAFGSVTGLCSIR